MSGEDYLWDRSGEPDSDVQRLEALLQPLRGRPAAPEWPVVGSGPPRRVRTWLPLAAAAMLVIATGAAWIWSRSTGPGQGWTMAWLDGATWADARVVEETRVGEGEWVDTGNGRARLAVGAIGEVQLEPGTRMRIVDVGRASHRLSVARGVIHALIWAPPGQFIVDTPSAVAVDLGCRYSLEVREDGSGLLRVAAGWVGFEHRGVRSLVPADAVAATRTGRGPGTPYFADAPPALVGALEAIDFGPPGEPRRRALGTALESARPRDALSLWHLLTRTTDRDRSRVYDTLASLVPPPAVVTREGVLRGDGAMLDAWWNALGLGPAEFWRTWTMPVG